METEIVYENDDKKSEVLPIDNNKSLFKNSSIEGSGSESPLNSIQSQLQEINHSSLSSVNAIGKSNNSINISNDNNNKINLTNDQSSSLNITTNGLSNNKNISESIDLKLSKINNLSLDNSKDELSSLGNLLNSNNDNIKKSNLLDYSIISNNNIVDNNINKNNINNTNNKFNEGKKLKTSNDKVLSDSSKDSDKSSTNMFKKEVKEKMKEGLIPFFVKAKGYNAVFYYGEPNSKLGTVIEHYIKKINGSNEIKNNFYYNKKLIDLDSTIQQIKIKPLSLISNEIK